MANIHPQRIIDRLERFPPALRGAALSAGDDARFKPAPEHWSVLEIVCHLGDEEAEDFRVRLKATFSGEAWPVLDLEGIAQRRGYNARNLEQELRRFERERRESVAWLRGFLDRTPTADWSTAYQHPKFGPIRAGDLLSSWAAHDALHLRQIAKRLYNLASRDAEGFSTGYAGDWSA